MQSDGKIYWRAKEKKACHTLIKNNALRQVVCGWELVKMWHSFRFKQVSSPVYSKHKMVQGAWYTVDLNSMIASNFKIKSLFDMYEI